MKALGHQHYQFKSTIRVSVAGQLGHWQPHYVGIVVWAASKISIPGLHQYAGRATRAMLTEARRPSRQHPRSRLRVISHQNRGSVLATDRTETSDEGNIYTQPVWSVSR